MGVVAEPTLFCDFGDGRIEPGTEVLRLSFGTLVRVESPSFEAPYAEVRSTAQDDMYLHGSHAASIVLHQELDEDVVEGEFTWFVDPDATGTGPGPWYGLL